MLARSRKIIFKNGAQIKSPILIPSFSSKGWRFKKIDDRDVSEINDPLHWSTEFITKSVLFSAYDLYYRHYDGPSELGEFTDITIIDSGGYETAEDHDLSTVYTYPWPIKEWTPDKLDDLVGKLPTDRNVAIVNYDHGKHRSPLLDQIDSASDYFNRHPQFDSIFLIKPETAEQDYVQTKHVLKNIEKLRNFNIIGLTEKELGNTFHERMLTIAKIRSKLDEEGITAPIHIFGALDTIAPILYFMAGAEIFDGLTWLRYAFHKGLTIYNENNRILNPSGPKVRLKHSTSTTLANNLMYLESMKDEMINFARTKDFDSFEYNRDILEKTFKGFESRL